MIAAALAAGSDQPPIASPVEPQCADDAATQYICGIPVPEDLVAIPGTPWVIVSSMPRDGSAGGLYLVDGRSGRVEKVRFQEASGRWASTAAEAAQVARCEAPDPAQLNAHGLSLSEGENDTHRLYVVGHGGREAIELFNVFSGGEKPVLRWTGCVPMPEGLEANSVVGLPGGGLMFTSLYDSGETDWPSRIGKLASGSPAGGVFEWHAGTGLRQLEIPPMSGPNGIAVSDDGSALFLAGWGDRMLRRLDRQGKETAPPLKLDFLPDNLHWAPDRSLLASGQRIGVGELFACTAQKDPPRYCAQGWSVARIDTGAMALLNDWHRDTGDRFGDSTSAIMIDGRLWIGSINDQCLALVGRADRSNENADEEIGE